LPTAFYLDAVDPTVWRIDDNIVGQITTCIMGVVTPFQQFRYNKRFSRISRPDIVPYRPSVEPIVVLKKTELYHFLSFSRAHAFNWLSIGERSLQVWAKIAQLKDFSSLGKKCSSLSSNDGEQGDAGPEPAGL
jgi:hypothetical protein